MALRGSKKGKSGKICKKASLFTYFATFAFFASPPPSFERDSACVSRRLVPQAEISFTKCLPAVFLTVEQ
jgi:hypothetical protein